VLSGGFGEQVSACLEDSNLEKSLDVMHVSLPDEYVEHGSVDKLKEMLGLDPQSIADRILASLDGDK